MANSLLRGPQIIVHDGADYFNANDNQAIKLFQIQVGIGENIEIEPITLLSSKNDKRFDAPYLRYLKDGWIITPTLSGGATTPKRALERLKQRSSELYEKLDKGEYLTKPEYFELSEIVYEVAIDLLHEVKNKGKIQL